VKLSLYVSLGLLTFPLVLSAKLPIKLQKLHDGYRLDYTLPEWRIVTVDRLEQVRQAGFRGEVYYRIRIPGFKYTDGIGKPELPIMAFYMAVADPAQLPRFELLQKVEEHFAFDNPLYPAQIPWAKSRPLSQRPFSINAEYYNSEGVKAPFANVDEVIDMRGVPVVRIEIAPFYYNPRLNTVTVVKQFSLKIKTDTGIKYSGLDSRAFEKYLKHVLINFTDAIEPVRKERQYDEYLIITKPAFESDLAEFVRFRKNRFNVTLVTTSSTGTSTTRIESYIRGLNPLPSFILLVGETGDIPMKSGSASDYPKTDLYYSCKDNSDYYPDMFLGRFSVSNSEQLDNVIYKTMFMESNMPTIDKAGVFVGGVDENNGYTAEATHNYIISTHFIPDSYDCKKIYMNSGQGSEAEYKRNMNSGVIWNIYSGHGSPTTWTVGAGNFSSFDAADVQGLTNATSFPYSCAFACNTGSMTTSECISEAWVRTNKHGAVTHIGASVTSYWEGDDDMERGMVDAIYDDTNPVTSIAGSMTAGKANVGSSRRRYFEMYNLMGDPALNAVPVEIDPLIAVSSPNGGEKWEQFTAQTIFWHDNIEGKVRIELLKAGTVVALLADSTASDGEFVWDIPATVAMGDDYRIKVASIDSAALFDESDGDFSITGEYIIDDFPYREQFDELADTGADAPLPEKYEQLTDDDFDWLVFEGPTPSRIGSSPNVTGPSADHSSGNGKYIYIEASSPNNPDKEADIITPKFNFKTLVKPRLIFWYHMFSDSNHMGDLYLDINVDGTWHNDVVHLTNDHGDTWLPKMVDLLPFTGDRVRFRFRGITGQSWASDIALDDITVTAYPVFTSTPVETVSIGADYSYTITASDEDNNGSHLKFGFKMLPSWLALSDNGDGTAALCGIPGADNAGDNPVVVTVTDGYIGEPEEQSFTVTVSALPPPEITAQPKDITVDEGEPAEFSITATGDNLRYQWQRDGKDISGATQVSYTLPLTVLSDNRTLFRCVVGNSGGSDTSSEAELTVLPVTAVLNTSSDKINPKDLMISPNPAYEFVMFSLSLKDVSNAELVVYDPLGNAVWETDFSEEIWDLRKENDHRVTSGPYLAVLRVTVSDGTVRQVAKPFGIKNR